MQKVYEVSLQHKTTMMMHYDHYPVANLNRLKRYVTANADGMGCDVVAIDKALIPNTDEIKEIPEFFE